MYTQPTTRSISGWIVRRDGRRYSTWYGRVRFPSGEQRSITLGRVWSQRGKPPAGYMTKRQAQKALEEVLVDARRGEGIAAERPPFVTFAELAERWMENGETTRSWKPGTVRDRRSLLNAHLLPAFGHLRLDEVTPQRIEAWRSKRLAAGMGRRTAIKCVVALHGIFAFARRAEGLRVNPVDDVEPLRDRYDSSRFDFYSVDEVEALARAAESEQDATIYRVAAFTGLRMGELLGLRVRDVDFPNSLIRVERALDSATGVAQTTKGGKARVVPMIPAAAMVLARQLERPNFTSDDDLVFVSATGGRLDGSGLRKRYKAAQAAAAVKPLRFHDLRHTFASLAINVGSITEVQSWCGHSDARTTQRYLHHKSRGDEAARLAAAFAPEAPDDVLDAPRSVAVFVDADGDECDAAGRRG